MQPRPCTWSHAILPASLIFHRLFCNICNVCDSRAICSFPHHYLAEATLDVHRQCHCRDRQTARSIALVGNQLVHKHATLLFAGLVIQRRQSLIRLPSIVSEYLQHHIACRPTSVFLFLSLRCTRCCFCIIRAYPEESKLPAMPQPGQRPTTSAPSAAINAQQVTFSNQTADTFLGGRRPSWMHNVQPARADQPAEARHRQATKVKGPSRPQYTQPHVSLHPAATTMTATTATAATSARLVQTLPRAWTMQLAFFP